MQIINEKESIESTLAQLREEWGIDFNLAHTVALTILNGKWHTDNEIAEELRIAHRFVRAVRKELSPFLIFDDVRYRVQDPPDEINVVSNYDLSPTEKSSLIRQMDIYIANVPLPLKDLDHVTATAATCIERALLLTRQYNLQGSHVVFIGDHDLTSVALRLVNKDVSISVVDIDERLLGYLAELSDEKGLGIRLLFSDFRIGLPQSLEGQADITFTDPPYTSSGIGLFATRAIQSLRQDKPSRLLLCYGYSYYRTDQGYEIQSTLNKLRLLFESVIPKFNHYHGAYAIGSSADLYITRPTRRSLPAAESYSASIINIYSKGTSAVESGQSEPDLIPKLEASNIKLDESERLTLVGFGFPNKHNFTWTSLSGYFNTALRSKYNLEIDKSPFGQTTVISLIPDHDKYAIRVIVSSRTPRLILIATTGTSKALFESDENNTLGKLANSFYNIERIHNSKDGIEFIELSYKSKPNDEVEQILRGISNRKEATLLNAWRKELDFVAKQKNITITKNEIREIIYSSEFADRNLSNYFIDLSSYDLRLLVRNVSSSVEHLLKKK